MFKFSLPLPPNRRLLALVACVGFLLLSLQANAVPAAADARLKVAPDLMAVVSASTRSIVPWARLLNGELLVRVLVTSNADDESLTALRGHVLTLGGSVHYRYSSMRMAAVLLPASRVLELAQRADVAEHFAESRCDAYGEPAAGHDGRCRCIGPQSARS